MNSARKNYREVADRFIALLEAGIRPWIQPWQAQSVMGTPLRPLRHCAKPYRGMNVLLLGLGAIEDGFAAPVWLTQKQGATQGGYLRRGARGRQVFFAGRFCPGERPSGRGRTKAVSGDAGVFYLKAYRVYNAEEFDGLAPVYREVTERQPLSARLEQAGAFFAALPGEIQVSGRKAFYAAGPDMIRMPPFEAFDHPQAFYGCLAHEYVHYSGAPHRLGCKTGRRFGDADYAAEELRAEIGASLLCLELGIVPDIPAESAAYVGHWLDRLGKDPAFLFRAAGQAQKAVDWLMGQTRARGWTPPEENGPVARLSA